MHFFFFFFSEYLLHLLFLQLFALSAQGGELLGGGLLGGASHTSQVFLHFFLFLSEYLLHLLFLHHFALSAHGGELGGAPVVVVPPPQAQHASSACTLATDPSARTAHHL